MKTGAWFAILLVLLCLPRSSRPSIQPKFWLKCNFCLIDISSNVRQHRKSSSDIVCRVHLSVLNTWALMPVPKQTVFRTVRFVWKLQEIVTGERYWTEGHVLGEREPTLFFEDTMILKTYICKLVTQNVNFRPKNLSFPASQSHCFTGRVQQNVCNLPAHVRLFSSFYIRWLWQNVVWCKMELSTIHCIFKQVGMLHAVTGWVTLNNSSDCSIFIFNFKQLKLPAPCR